MFGRHLTPRIFAAVLITGAVGLAACGSDDADGELPTVATSAPSSGEVLGTGNVGGPVVDPKPHPIDDIAIAESYPEQLMVRFTTGDPNCAAADATATAIGDTVTVTLTVGVTEDALTRSCVAGDFEQTVSIPLTSGLDGRQVVAADI